MSKDPTGRESGGAERALAKAGVRPIRFGEGIGTQANYDERCCSEYLRGMADGHSGRDNPPADWQVPSGTTRVYKSYRAGQSVATAERHQEDDLID